MLQHILASGDGEYFSNCAFPVDVFHCKSKHKETDVFCATWCNPAAYPDLITDEQKWRFNSSIAEQTNAWFEGYQAIMREMRVERYNFFLDEMIRRRNDATSESLGRKGHLPHLIPRAELLKK